MAQLLSPTATDFEVISLWLSDKSKTSQITYQSTVKQFLEFVAKPLNDLTLEDLGLWQKRLEFTYSPATINNKILTVRSLLRYCYEVGYINVHIGFKLKAKPLPNTLNQKCLEVDEVKKLIAQTTNDRDLVLFSLMFGCGLRVSEAINLKWDDLQGDKLTVFGKGGKSRTIKLSHQLLTNITRLERKSNLMFVSYRGKRLTRGWVHEIIKKCAVSAGINPKVSCHWLRHSHATAALKNGCDIFLLKESLGHSNISTTQKYLSNNPEEGSSLFIEI